MKPLTFAKLSAMNEDQAREYLEGIRWPHGPICAHCGNKGATLLEGKSTRPGVYKCNVRSCRKPFTVTVGTIFHRSHISLRQWLMAFHLICASKKGMSALQLQRMLGLKSYKSAWHLAHRVRWAMTQPPLAALLKGTVEVDETYIGGKPRHRDPKNQGGAVWKKAAVMALVERGGAARAFPIEKLTSKHLHLGILRNVDRSARIITDEHQGYPGIALQYAGGHETVNHSSREYVRSGTDVHTNTVEGFFSLLKRGVYGTFHHVSRQHLHRYADEFAFRYTHRKVTDGERMNVALRAVEGKRLTYRQTQPKPVLEA